MLIVHANEATAAKRRVYFQLVDSTDGITAETGEAAGQPQVSSDGAAWTNTGIGTLTHIGNGRYYADLTQTLVATAGTIIETRYKSANTAEAVGDQVRVIAVDLNDTELPADIISISGDSTAADNLEAQYDTTGLTGDTFPSTQAQVNNFAVGSAAISTVPRSSPDGFVITTGSAEANTEDSTHALDGVTHDLEDTAGTTDCYYIFDVGGNGVPTTITWNGYINSVGDTYEFYAYNWAGTAWEQIGSRAGVNGTTVVTQDFSLTTAHVGTGANLGLVRFRIYSTNGTKVATDRITCSYAVVAESVGYADGAVWVDSSGTAGSEIFVNGTADNPCPWANALTINSTLGLNRFRIASANTVTLAASASGYSLIGESWNLALGGQSINGAAITGATITGTSTGGATAPLFENCRFGAATVPPFEAHDSGFGVASGTLTAASDGDYVLHNCYSLVPGSGSPAFAFSGLGAATGINNRAWTGGASWTLDSDCTLSHEVLAGGGCTVTTGGANVEVRGITRALTLNLSGAGTCQFVGTTGPITLSGTTTATVNLYGVSAGVTDTTSAATVTDKTVSRENVNTEADTAISDASLATAASIAALNDPTAAAIADQVWEEAIADHSGTAGSTAEALDAAGGGTTPAAIADAVWTEAIADHSGTAGSTAEALSAVSGASGAVGITVQVNDSGASPIPNAKVYVYDSTNTSFVTVATANGTGLATIALETADTYALRVVAAGFGFTVPESIVVAADGDSFTVTGTTATLSDAADPQYCKIQTTAPLCDASGEVLNNYLIVFSARTPQTAQSSVLHEREVEVYTDSSGHFEVDLLRGAEVFTGALEAGHDGRFARTVPDAASQDFATWS